jgi:hypothetical protein
MNPLTSLLSRLADQGLRMELRDEQIAVTPKNRLTPELRDEILQHRPDVLELLRLHGSSLLPLFRNAPTWPPCHGRSSPAGHVWSLIGQPVRLADGREGLLRFAEYDTRSGRLRCFVDFANGWKLADPEDMLGPSPNDSQAKEEVVTPQEDARLERIRIESFEGRP